MIIEWQRFSQRGGCSYLKANITFVLVVDPMRFQNPYCVISSCAFCFSPGYILDILLAEWYCRLLRSRWVFFLGQVCPPCILCIIEVLIRFLVVSLLEFGESWSFLTFHSKFSVRSVWRAIWNSLLVAVYSVIYAIIYRRAAVEYSFSSNALLIIDVALLNVLL